ncbi:unnamed protein product [Spirodela intermedia]|uniref:endo-polygalacturonase n=1 Tax=Spirodela intermedia TaxID=51605 RepID=A0A7I8ISF8_SPIIN|nr:unnamed protein product [Spirodela intermedia]CAA6660799.1 unnamed protein product [Spirodela intermedia]
MSTATFSFPTAPSVLFIFLLISLTFFCVHTGGAEGSDPLIRLPRRGGEGDGRDDPLGSKKILSVQDYGAVGDGIHDDTQAFKDGWYAACSSTSRKTVLKVPEKRRYLVRPIDFSGPCTTNVTLRHSRPPNPTAWRRQNPRRWLYFHEVSNLALRGRGVGIVDGMGERWWAKSCKVRKINPCRPSPTAITFHKCRHLKVRNMTLLNSPHSHITFTGCFHVKVSGLKVIAPVASPETAGIHISGSETVYIQKSEITTGEDCISVGKGSSKVRIRNVSCGPGHGISIGSLGKLNSWSKVSDVQVDGAVLTNTKTGLRIKTWQGGQGLVDGITFQNVTMKNVSNPIIIDQYYCDTLQPCKNQTSAVKVNRVSFMNIVGTSATRRAMTFACSDTFPCQRIHLQNIHLPLESGGNSTSFCWKASGFSYGLVDPPSCLAIEDDYPVMKAPAYGEEVLRSSYR